MDVRIRVNFLNTLCTCRKVILPRGRCYRWLSPARNYVIWSAHLRSPRHPGRNPTEQVDINSHYVITRVTLVHDHITRVAIIDKIINANDSKAPWKAQQINAFRYWNASTTRMHERSPTFIPTPLITSKSNTVLHLYHTCMTSI